MGGHDAVVVAGRSCTWDPSAYLSKQLSPGLLKVDGADVYCPSRHGHGPQASAADTAIRPQSGQGEAGLGLC